MLALEQFHEEAFLQLARTSTPTRPGSQVPAENIWQGNIFRLPSFIPRRADFVVFRACDAILAVATEHVA
jgi:hypothetical protein